MEAEVNVVGQALVVDNLSEERKQKVEQYKTRLNAEDVAWEELKQETDAAVLATLMWDWLDQLKVRFLSLNYLQLWTWRRLS